MNNQVNAYTWKFKVTFKDNRVKILEGNGNNIGTAYNNIIEYLINANLYDKMLYVKDYDLTN